MRLARRVAGGLVLGALIGFLYALLRPRKVRTVTERAPETLPQASPTVITDPTTQPLTLPLAGPHHLTGGTA